MKTGIGWIDEHQGRPAKISQVHPYWYFCNIGKIPHDAHTANEGYTACGGWSGTVPPTPLYELSEKLSKAQRAVEVAEIRLREANQRSLQASRECYEWNLLWNMARHRESTEQ